MTQAKKGDTVKVHYTGALDDGTVFDSSNGRDPLEFTVGEGAVIQGLEEAVEGMSPGEEKTVKVGADRAYGPHHEEMVVDVERKRIPSDIKPEVGLKLQISREDGKISPVTVTGVTEEKVTLDANHPLAGKDLTFEIKLLDVA